MKLLIYAFFMTWGMFLAVPCPLKIWDEKARPLMMACLPLIGLIPGGLWVLAAWGLPKLGCPRGLMALILTALPYLTTGFMHLDGFMDCCDAILSRRDLETRQKILKDSHCGAFAVICLALLLLTQFSLFLGCGPLPLLSLGLIPVAVRSGAGLAVLTLRPLGSSQYAHMDREKNRGKLLFLALVLGVSVTLPPVFCGIRGLAPLIAAAAYGLSVWGADRNLGGMSGDISGFGLCLGELAGVAALILL